MPAVDLEKLARQVLYNCDISEKDGKTHAVSEVAMEQGGRLPGSPGGCNPFDLEHGNLVGAALCGPDVSDLVFH